MRIERRYTKANESAYAGIEFRSTTSEIRNPDGSVVFKLDGIAAINLELLYLFQRARLPHAGLWSFHILFLTIPFVLMTSWPADLVYLPFAQSLLIWQILKKEETPTLRAIATFLIVPSIIVSNIVFFNLLGNSGVYGSVGFIFWANLLLLLASYMELLPSALRQIRTKTSGARLMSREG